MGNSSSGDDNQDEFDKFDGIDTLGYRVLGVQPDSPASLAGLVSFFDFLCGVNGKMLLGTGDGLEEGDEYDDVDLPAILRESLGKELELLVYNIKSQETRLVTLVPSDSWGGAGLLGVTIRLDNYGGADERLIRVLTVEHNSPAAIAGLVSEQDYLLGTVSESLDDSQSLANLLMLSADQVVEFYVYNTNSDVVRVVPLMPTWSWGGKGLLGAEVGTGYLHRLPHAARGTSGTSIARKVRYVAANAANGTNDNNGDNNGDSSPDSGNALGSLEHEPQLELEAEEGGHVTMASPDDVADMANSTKNRNNSGGQAAVAVAAAVAAPVEETTEHEAMEGDGIIVESPPPHAEKRSETAAELFAGPPPPEEEVVDLR